MKNRLLYSLITWIALLQTIQAQNLQIHEIQYDSVVAYDYNGEEGFLIVGEDNKLYDRINQSIHLKKKQIKKLHKIITAKNAYGAVNASCFDPHLGIVYYYQNQIVAHLSICLDCNYLSASFEIPAIRKKMIYLGEGYSYPAKGFSKTSQKKFRVRQQGEN